MYNSYYVSAFHIRNSSFKNDTLLKQSKIYNLSDLIQFVNLVDSYIKANTQNKKNEINDIILSNNNFDDGSKIDFDNL